jgi:SPP1 gp7 family putative phage head morphogenesis protein
MSLENVFERYDLKYAQTLIASAAKSFAAGDISAQTALKIKLSMRLVQKESVEYSKKYKKDLIEKGGTWVAENDKKVFKTWFADSTEEQRTKVAEIIANGLRDGKPTGVKQGKNGKYPKGSIAEQLHEYFNARHSHASMVARTEVARIQYEGMMNRYEKHGIVEVKWLHSHLGNARIEHLERDGKVYKVGEEPPLGEPNCRCTYVGVPKKIDAS